MRLLRGAHCITKLKFYGFMSLWGYFYDFDEATLIDLMGLINNSSNFSSGGSIHEEDLPLLIRTHTERDRERIKLATSTIPKLPITTRLKLQEKQSYQ